MFGEPVSSAEGEIKVSFGYQCNGKKSVNEDSDGCEIIPKARLRRSSGSFSCLSGAALSANTTLANTNICNGLIGSEILPSWDSPNSFHRISSSPLLSKMDFLSSSLQNTLSNLSVSPSALGESLDCDFTSPSTTEGLLNAMEVQVAGGAAGEDRVQAVCSEEDGWLFCAVFDGFNGRDAADFLAGTLYDTFLRNFNLFNWDNMGGLASDDMFHNGLETGNVSSPRKSLLRIEDREDVKFDAFSHQTCTEIDTSSDFFKQAVLECLERALIQAERDFLSMVEWEMEDRPDLVSVGSCVLVALLVGKDLYTLNLGDSRVVVATQNDDNNAGETDRLKAIQLTDIHNTDNEAERSMLLATHADDPAPITAGKVKGKLKVTRAFGVGYLKKKILNDALMGILRVRNLISPPYISTTPTINVHRISKSDRFVVLGSDGLFDFFTNEEVVILVHLFISKHPSGDPAKFLLEQLVIRAADCAGFSMEELMNIPPGRRRKYHDDVTVIVILLGKNQRTSKASTCL
ncbi:probable protein phosphatase 2C 40 [Amaranthus tricolor]|uniref:probable protein phosphatase 2C 40 n=1 Tax=Amaranthus tricolor TaxID=29722 RepID=UPI00258C9043|nr:probable protein phosphatase 2C 40 [Amaranthus tricolor]